jgi:DNA-binding NarL/FixJ family response regulator
MNADFTKRLSPRQRQVLTRLSFGRTNKEIARDLGISEQTVKNHLRLICKAAGLYGAGSRLRLALDERGCNAEQRSTSE